MAKTLSQSTTTTQTQDKERAPSFILRSETHSAGQADDIPLSDLETRAESPATSRRSADGASAPDDPASDGAGLNVVEQEDVPPNGGYGWVCTACVFVINAHTWGVNSAWAIFLAYYLSNSTFPGATRFDFALVGGLSISQSCVVIPAIAVVNRRLGTRFSLLIGTLLVFAALLAASFATQIWHLYLSQGVCFGWGMGFLYIPATAVLPQWFSSKRSLAMGLASAGAGIGGLAYNLATQRAVETLGLPWAYRILAFCSLGANLISSLLLRDRNKTVRPPQPTFAWREYTRPETLLVVAWGTFTELGYIVLLYSLPNYATTVGLSYAQGSVVSALLNLSLGAGRPLVGLASDRWGRINIAALFTFACGVFCVALWVPATSYAALLAFALAAGTCCGIFWNTVAPVTAEVVGLRRLPSAFGMICLVLTLPATFAEPVALRIVDTSGYLASQVFVGCMFFAGAACTWMLRCWKIAEVEGKRDAEAREAAGEASEVEGGGDIKGRWLTPRRVFVRGRY